MIETAAIQPVDVSAIVQTNDPELVALAQRLLTMDDDALIEMTAAADEFVKRAEADAFRILEEKIGQDRMLVRIAKAVIHDRIASRNAKMLPSDRYRCELVSSKTIDKRVDVLRKLEGKVPADRLKKALWVEGVDITGVEPEAVDAVIAAGAKPTYNSNATQLKKLATDFGGEIAKIVSEGVVDVYGPPRLVFEPLPAEKNVTPEQIAS